MFGTIAALVMGAQTVSTGQATQALMSASTDLAIDTAARVVIAGAVGIFFTLMLGLGLSRVPALATRWIRERVQARRTGRFARVLAMPRVSALEHRVPEAA